MKRNASPVLTCLLALCLIVTTCAVAVGAAGFDGVAGYQKAYDFNNMATGAVANNGGNTATSPLRGNGGYTATITEDWNYFGDSGKSLELTSDTAHGGCFQLELPHDDTNGTVDFANIAYTAMIMAVKAPAAPETGADSRGFYLNMSLNDWGTYYKPMKVGDVYMLQAKGSDTWTDVTITDDFALWVPYGFEGFVKIPLKIFYKDADNQLKDYEIQHEVLVETWLPNFNGSVQGAFYLDDVYLCTAEADVTTTTEATTTESTTTTTESEATTTTTEAETTTTTAPVGEKDGAKELSDYEGFTVGDVVAGGDIPEGDAAIWNGYDFTVKATDKFVGNGSVGLEFSSEDKRVLSWSIIAMIKSGDGNIEGKDYILFHIATPSEDSSKSPAYEDGQGNARFAFALIPKAEGYWFKTNSMASDNVQMMADGEATWSNIPGDDFYNYLPFGWSGWIKYDLDGFSADGAGETILEDTMTLTAIEFYASQCGKAFGNIYLDSFFAVDGDDELACGVSAQGNKNGESEGDTTTTTTDDLYVPIYGTTTTTAASTGNDGDGKNPDTGVPLMMAIPALAAVAALAGIVVSGKGKARTAK